MTERQFQSAVQSLCDVLGLLWYHVPDSRRCRAGFPDLVIASPAGVLFRELKTAKGRVREEQDAWLDALQLAGENAGVWRPEDWTSGRVERELREIAIR